MSNKNTLKKIERGQYKMNCGSYGSCCSPARGFFTKKEKLEMLKEYKETLDMESKGVAERIEELEQSKD